MRDILGVAFVLLDNTTRCPHISSGRTCSAKFVRDLSDVIRSSKVAGEDKRGFPFCFTGKMHLGGHEQSARHSAGHSAANAVRRREEGALQGGCGEASSSQSGCAHQATER